MSKIFFSFLLAIVLAQPALADEASVKKAVEDKLGGKVGSVTKTGYLGLYEVYVDGQIFYTDENISAILAGSLIDGRTMQNVTAERLQKLSAINFSELPLDLAIKRVRGDGKRVFATFEDPNCGYCKRLAKEMTSLDNVTIYTFLMPILSPDSLEKSNRIWCSANRGKAWTDWMIDGKAPTGKGDCDTSAVRKTVELGQKLKISGTPTLFFTDGTRIPGAVPLAQIQQKLDQLAAAR
ncbi:MAG: DsbC family protein [Candidatus Accumulibacter sp.]|jgi:thiol:disulfide interchange protein DsbC|nr:DsbC family protein [Accumulibacter sp.]